MSDKNDNVFTLHKHKKNDLNKIEVNNSAYSLISTSAVLDFEIEKKKLQKKRIKKFLLEQTSLIEL